MATQAHLLWTRPTLYVLQREAPSPAGRGKQTLYLLLHKLGPYLPTWEGHGVHIGVSVSILNLRDCISKVVHPYRLDCRCDGP
jgi:hypothetical protein